MGWLGAIIVGFLAGIVARAITPGPSPRGFILTTVLGIVGALLATLLGQAIGLFQSGEPYGFSWFVTAVVGAVIILLAWRQLARAR
ncbi:MAG: GlsB/YeaQ/YmgE family stress response membrane protein [Devosia sp.]